MSTLSFDHIPMGDDLSTIHENSNYLRMLRNYQLPRVLPVLRDWDLRIKVTTELNVWPVMHWDWIHQLSTIIGKQSVLEIGAGSGHLSSYLSDFGVRIIPTDPRPRGPVKMMTAKEAVQTYDFYYLLCSWPEYQSEYLTEVCLLQKVKRVIYIGEPAGGCTASSSFFDIFDIHQVIEIPTWYRLHDALFMGSIRD